MKKSYRSVFISDFHLGSKGCKADLLYNFLKNVQCDNLYLVGDIIDGWKIKAKRWHWNPHQTDVVRRILRMARHSTKIVYITGNHDEFLRHIITDDVEFDPIDLCDFYTHYGVDGKKYLVVHGDLFDGIHRMHRWISFLGDYAYDALLSFNSSYNWMRRKMGFGYWSVSAYAKSRVKRAVNFVFEFENSMIDHCKRKGYDGVICGHIHTPTIKDINGVIYMNSGDWVESCSALVENHDGTFEIIEWKNIISD
jgi:UDP-2,3-diacylglucosamine pyrophosphatase LpxH